MSVVEFILQVLASKAFLACCHLFRRSNADDITALVSAVRSKINDVVGTLNHLQIMFNNDNAVATFNKGIEGIEQSSYVVEVQACSWLVEDE